MEVPALPLVRGEQATPSTSRQVEGRKGAPACSVACKDRGTCHHILGHRLEASGIWDPKEERGPFPTPQVPASRPGEHLTSGAPHVGQLCLAESSVYLGSWIGEGAGSL